MNFFQLLGGSSEYMEAFEHLLEAWIVILHDANLFPEDFIKDACVNMFNAYVQAHLSPPDGCRPQVTQI